MPLVYAHEILSQCDVYFLNGGHFSKFLYLALLFNMIKLRAFIFGTVMHLYWATHRVEIIHLSVIFLKL